MSGAREFVWVQHTPLTPWSRADGCRGPSEQPGTGGLNPICNSSIFKIAGRNFLIPVVFEFHGRACELIPGAIINRSVWACPPPTGPGLLSRQFPTIAATSRARTNIKSEGGGVWWGQDRR